MKIKFIFGGFVVVAVCMFAVFTYAQGRSAEVGAAITGTNPVAGQTTGIGQVVTPIIKSPLSSPQQPTNKGPAVPYPQKEPTTGNYYGKDVKVKGKYYKDDAKVDGRYQKPKIKPTLKVDEETEIRTKIKPGNETEYFAPRNAVPKNTPKSETPEPKYLIETPR